MKALGPSGPIELGPRADELDRFGQDRGAEAEGTLDGIVVLWWVKLLVDLPWRWYAIPVGSWFSRRSA